MLSVLPALRKSLRYRAPFVIAVALFTLTVATMRPTMTLAASSEIFNTVAGTHGGEILTGALGKRSINSALTAMLHQIHKKFDTRPTIVQVVQNSAGHSLALIFSANRSGEAYTGMSIVTAAPGARAGGVAMYDKSARFGSTFGPMMQQVKRMMDTASGAKALAMAPVESLVEHQFADGTGTIAVPDDWQLRVAAGGSALAIGPAGEVVGYNLVTGALDPSYATGQNYLRALPPQLRESFISRTAILAYSGDPVRTWTTITDQLAKQRGRRPSNFIVEKSSATGRGTAEISGTGDGGNVRYVAYVQVAPPNGMGQWNMFDTFVLVPKTRVAKEGRTAAAILKSVRINTGAFAAQGAAIRGMFQQQFDAMIAHGEQENVERQRETDNALATDRATQEGMHKQAVSWENYSLDRAVVVNTTTGAHSTVDSDFADYLVHGSSDYEKVPANELLRGVDY